MFSTLWESVRTFFVPAEEVQATNVGSKRKPEQASIESPRLRQRRKTTTQVNEIVLYGSVRLTNKRLVRHSKRLGLSLLTNLQTASRYKYGMDFLRVTVSSELQGLLILARLEALTAHLSEKKAVQKAKWLKEQVNQETLKLEPWKETTNVYLHCNRLVVAKRYWKGQLFDLGAYDTEELAAEAFEKLDEEATDVTDPDTVAEIAERIEQESYEEEEEDDDDDDDDDEEEEEDDE